MGNPQVRIFQKRGGGRWGPHQSPEATAGRLAKGSQGGRDVGGAVPYERDEGRGDERAVGGASPYKGTGGGRGMKSGKKSGDAGNFPLTKRRGSGNIRRNAPAIYAVGYAADAVSFQTHGPDSRV